MVRRPRRLVTATYKLHPTPEPGILTIGRRERRRAWGWWTTSPERLVLVTCCLALAPVIAFCQPSKAPVQRSYRWSASWSVTERHRAARAKWKTAYALIDMNGRSSAWWRDAHIAPSYFCQHFFFFDTGLRFFLAVFNVSDLTSWIGKYSLEPEVRRWEWCDATRLRKGVI